MAADLEKLATYYTNKGNAPRANFYSALAAEERASGTPETFLETLVLPEGVIRLPDLTIGGVKPKDLEKALGNRVSDYARDLLRSKDFITLPRQQVISPIIATPSVMGLIGTPTTEQIYERADKLNWDLCPAEVGPHLVIAFNNKPTYKDLPIKLPIWIGMKQIADRYGSPRVFLLDRRDDGLWGNARWARPTFQWDPTSQLVFSLRK